MTLGNILWVGLGGGIGAMLRYAIKIAMSTNSASHFPWGTLTANLVGCFVMGLAGAYAYRAGMSQTLSLFLMVGILGGFTTFSSFGLETLNLMNSPYPQQALWYVLASNAGGLLLVFGGWKLMQQWL